MMKHYFKELLEFYGMLLFKVLLWIVFGAIGFTVALLIFSAF